MEQELANKILQELRAFRADTEKRFDAIDKRFEANDKRFDAIDARFDAMDARFDANDKRFDAMDARFEANDKRLNTMDKRFDAFEKELATIKRSTLTMEHELTRKIDILLETRVDANNNYQNLRLENAKLNKITEMHAMQIEFLQNKCESKC